MITREAIEKVLSNLARCECMRRYEKNQLSVRDCDACNYNMDLFHIAEQLLKERDAYRSMLIGKYTKETWLTKQEYEKAYGITRSTQMPTDYRRIDTDWDAIDEEAQQILKQTT